jgi:dienelactone hydrolase
MCDVFIPSDGVVLEGNLTLPATATGLIIFAHGSGSSRFSSRNVYVAQVLNRAGLATLLFDLLTAEEQRVDEYTRNLRFDIALLTRRLTAAVDWSSQHTDTSITALPIGLFGASTGAAAAIVTAAHRPERVKAVVSRGGRPDLADHDLHRLQAPTLLIVGSRDDVVIQLNQQAARHMNAEHEMAIVSGATHLFEELGTLEEVARLATQWFVKKLTGAA